MSIGDFVILEQAEMTGRGARTYKVAAGATVINPGEPVIFGGQFATTVIAMGNNQPVSGSDYLVGIASTTSTNTTGTAGTVGVYPTNSAITFIAKPKVPASWDTQAEYDALVNSNVLVDLTSGAYTILAANGVNNGLKVMPMNIAEHPGVVAIAFRGGESNYR